MKIGKYSFGIGDRFGQQGLFQIKALMDASKEIGVEIVPVWNKSNREHTIVHSVPEDVRKEADNAVKSIGYQGQYFVDADHINLNNVEKFIQSSDFFTIDVADYIGKKADEEEIKNFIEKNKKYIGSLYIPGIEKPFTVKESLLKEIAEKYLFAIKEAANIYNYIASKKGNENFVAEVSMDEVNDPQTPVEMFFILSAISEYNIPAQTIAPKFTGRFNKGVDYVGDIMKFEKEFEEDILVIKYCIKEFGLPENLKLSVHSGSDKFSIYPIIGRLIKKHNVGVHIKTAGTTWLEEVIGLAMAGGEALEMAKKIYREAFNRREELCAPYATVIDIDPLELPKPDEVDSWDSERFASTLRHDVNNKYFNPHFRQLIHVGYKVAAENIDKYIELIKSNANIVGQQVYENIYLRHIKRLFQ